jgi:hypothetical protein
MQAEQQTRETMQAAKKNKRKKKKRQKQKQQKQEQRQLFAKGISMQDIIEDDLYAMMIPAEADNIISTSRKQSAQKKASLRAPFSENMPYDNLYQFQHIQQPSPD